MKNMRRVLSLLLALCLLLGDVAVPALAAEGTEPALEAVQEETVAAEPVEETTAAEQAAETTTAAAETEAEEMETEATEPEGTETTAVEEVEIPEVSDEYELTAEESTVETLAEHFGETLVLTDEHMDGESYTKSYEYQAAEAGTVTITVDSVSDGMTAGITAMVDGVPVSVNEDDPEAESGFMAISFDVDAENVVTICVTADCAGEIVWSGTFTASSAEENPEDPTEDPEPEETTTVQLSGVFSGTAGLSADAAQWTDTVIYEAVCDGTVTVTLDENQYSAQAAITVNDGEVQWTTGEASAEVRAGDLLVVKVMIEDTSRLRETVEISWNGSFTAAEGTVMTPKQLDSLDLVETSLAEGDGDGFYYTYCVAETGTLVFEYTVKTEGVEVVFNISKKNDETTELLTDDAQSRMAVSAGDELLIQVITVPDADGTYPAADISWKAVLTYPLGSSQNPVYPELNWNETHTEATGTVTAVAGQITYFAVERAAGMMMSVDNGEPEVLAAWELGKTEGIFKIDNTAGEADTTHEIRIYWPEGSVNNPEVLTDPVGGTALQKAGDSSGYWYTHTVTADGIFAFSIQEIVGGTAGDIVVTNGSVQESLADDGELTIQVEKGDVLSIQVIAFAEDWTYPEAEIIWTIEATYPEGGEKNPLVVEVAQGKAVSLTPIDPETGNTMNAKLFTWAVAAEDKAVAAVSNGKVTAKGKVGQTAVVTATLDGVTIFYEIRITVPATRVAIIDDRFSTDEADFEVNGMTGTIELKGEEGTGTAEWVLTAKAYGKDKTRNGVSQKIIWTSSDTRHAIVKDGVVTLLDAGAGKTVTITATAADGSGSKASIKIKMDRKVIGISFDQNTPKEVATGKSLKLAPSLLIAPGNATNKKVDWWLVNGEELVKKIQNIASITSAGVLSADKNAPNGTVVTVRCVAKDGSDVFGQYSVTIRPAATSVQLFEAGFEGNIAGKTVDIYLKNGQDKAIVLTAGNLPEGAAEGWTWTCSDKAITVADGQLTIPASRAGKTITVTATTMDGTNKKGSVKLRIIQPVEKLTLPAEEEVAGGKNVKLAENLEIWPANATNKKMDWWLVDSNGELVKKIAGVASITSAGVFVADKAATEDTKVTVKCVPLDGYKDENGMDASVTCTVMIKPITTAVTLCWKEEPEAGVFVMNVTDTLVIEAFSEPLDAKQDWTWKASVADTQIEKTEDNDFAVTFGPKSVGKTVTITAVATDGSNKKASLKIKVVQPVESLTWRGPRDAEGVPVIAVAQDKSQDLSKLVQVDQTNASNKALDWVLCEKDGTTEVTGTVASLKNGKLKAAAVSAITELCLVVSPQDGYKDNQGNPVCEPLKVKVMLYPVVATRVAIIDERYEPNERYYDVSGLTGQIDVVRTVNGGSGKALWVLAGKVYPYDTDPEKSACQQLIWTSSNTNWAVVDDSGDITLLEAGIGKTVTITASAADGSGKKASVKIKILEGTLSD